MNALIINSVCGYGSTGKICLDIAKQLEEQGYNVKIAYGRKYSDVANGIKISNRFDTVLHGLGSRLLDKHGLFSKKTTSQFLRWADQYNPDLIWLHNIHGYYINYELLFEWIKKRESMKVIWTLHDCWAITGHCAHFSFCRCERWKTGCNHCPQLSEYPKSIFVDNSEDNYCRKKKAFSNVHNMTIITPSNWLKNIIKESYLGQYPVEVIHNDINKDNTFRKVDKNQEILQMVHNKKIILCVASVWTERKGINDVFELNKEIDTDRYAIIIVGLSKKQMQKLPAGIVGIERTSSKEELVELYSTADVFFNPTYEDTYPSVNLEAQYCGTPVVTYDSCGCKETLFLEKSVFIKQGDLVEAKKQIYNICQS